MQKKGYKQTEIGMIPEDWEVKRLESLSNKIASGKSKTDHNEDGIYPIFGSTGVIGYKNYFDYEGEKITIARVGANAGRVNLIDGKFCISDNTLFVEINESSDIHFIDKYLRSVNLNKYIFGSGQPLITGTIIKNIQIPFPPLPEQTAIAAVLSDMDEYILSLERLIAKKKVIKQGAMQQLLNPVMHTDNTDETDNHRLNLRKSEKSASSVCNKTAWVEKKLGEISNICTGKKNNEDKVLNGKYPFFVRSQQVERINSYAFDGEAVIIPGEGNIGEIFHYINGKFDWHQRVYKISNFDDNCSGKYLFYYLKVFFGKYALMNSVKATVDSLRLPTFQKFIIKFPHDKAEQTAIATILSDMDAEIEALQAKLSKTILIKQGTMQQLLTGQIRLVNTSSQSQLISENRSNMAEIIPIGESERALQNRVIAFFRQQLDYAYLGNLQDRANRNILPEPLKAFLTGKMGYSDHLADKAIEKLNETAAACPNADKLYDANKKVYSLLKYGIKVNDENGIPRTVLPFNWEAPEENRFTLAEEVTVLHHCEKRPDLVIFVNGIALSVIELKKSTVSVSNGIRQNLTNQREGFIYPFFTTVQIVAAGNDSEGLRYGVINTPEKYFLEWKNYEKTSNAKAQEIIVETLHEMYLQSHIYSIYEKTRFLDIIHNFIIFDKGIKKICRHNQYFGILEAQQKIANREGGIIWHTQGSGKSLTMVWLSKWILSLSPTHADARVLIITDRDELDEQIEKTFSGVDEKIYRTKSCKDLLDKLDARDERIICSLVHKFGHRKKGGVKTDNYDAYIAELRKALPKDFSAKGDIFVFVDECHRTQSGKLHKAMKEILPKSVFIGFTGTPLLREDKKRSREVFGDYIHTYQYNEAVMDNVVLDLRYEARDIPQEVTNQEKIDEWFEAKTHGLSPRAKATLKQLWGNLQTLYSSRSRLEKIACDIIFDFNTKERLVNGNGNALLIAGGIYSACKYYEIFTSNQLDSQTTR